MEKVSLAEKMARKTFESKKIQESWQIHMKAFEPILKNAFVQCAQAKIHLCAALNHISKNQIKDGLQKMQLVEKFLETDADHAAFYYFIGLAYERAGIEEAMVNFYAEAGKYNHEFYLPYLKMARAMHKDSFYDGAYTNYQKALDCLEKYPDGKIFGPTYVNFASCLTNMHQYDKAMEMLERAEAFGMDTAHYFAIIYAVLGRKDEMNRLLDFSMHHKMVEGAINQILEGKHLQFCERDIDEKKVSEFWDWFKENEQTFYYQFKNEQSDLVFPELSKKYREVFEFMEGDPSFGLNVEGDKIELTSFDLYSKALQHGYEVLLAACPEELKARWIFKVER